MKKKNAKRAALLAMIALFLLPVLAAMLLNRVGWRPLETRNYGVLETPARDLTSVGLVDLDGAPFDWRDSANWPWMLLAVTGDDCAQDCLQVLDELRRVRLTLNHRVDRLRVVVVNHRPKAQEQAELGPLQWVFDTDGGLTELKPGHGEVSAVLVDPNGFLALRYAPGFDGNKLRRDVTRLVK